jgi:hypothetical protein
MKKEYQTNLSVASVRMICNGLKTQIKSQPKYKRQEMPELIRLQRFMLKHLSGSLMAFNKKRHQHIVLSVVAKHVELADVITSAARQSLLELHLKGTQTFQHTKDMCWVVDRMDTMKAYVLYPELRCAKCRCVGDKRSLLLFGGYCGRHSCKN